MTQLHDVVYVICFGSSPIVRFKATTDQRLTDINVKGLRDPWDIAACEQTSQLYLADGECIWRVSADGVNMERWWPTFSFFTFKPERLSVTSTRLLVTSYGTNQLMQLNADGKELRRLQLPDYIQANHAVETPTGTFIVSHKHTQLDQYKISEVNTEGEVLQQFSGSRLLSLGEASHVVVDSRANIFVADRHNRHILLLDAQLKLRRVIIDKHQLKNEAPWRLCYTERTGHLLVILARSVAEYDVLRR